MFKVAINGFGRIGRLILRNIYNNPELLKVIDVVAINDLSNPKTLAHLLKYDSTQSKFNKDVKYDDENIIIENKKIRIFSEKEPENLKWKELGIDLVVESTGIYCSEEGANKHIKAGAKKVAISAPAKGGDIKTIVWGVNENIITKDDKIISGASCTTNCLAPVLKPLNDAFTIKTGFMTTIHGYTGDQRILDATHKDLRRARAGAINIVPTTTGAAKAIGKVIPELNNKLNGSAVRVPVATGSLIDLSFTTEKECSVEKINEVIKNWASKSKNSLFYCDEPIVSSDIIGSEYGSIFDSLLTDEVTDGQNKMFKVISWYDNEMSYVSQFCRLMKYFLEV